MKKNIHSKFLVIAIMVVIFSGNLFSQIQVTLPVVSAQPGTEAIVGIIVNDLTPYNVMGYQLRLKYDKTKIYIKDPLDNSGTLSSAAGVSPFYTADTRTDSSIIVVVAASASSKITGSGILFKVKIKYLTVGSTSITIDPTFNNKFTDGTNNITFTSVDGLATISTTNNPPVFNAIGAQTVDEGKELKFTVTAVDNESDPITYSVTSKPEGSNFNTATHEFSWIPSYSQQGTYTVTFSASDGHSSSTLNVSVTVNNINTAPQINSVGDKNIKEGDDLSFEIIAADAESDILTYTATNLPTGANFNQQTHIFSWKPSGTQAGTYNLTFTVSDGVLSNSINVKIVVADNNLAPVITAISDKTVNTGQTLTFDIVATDPDGDAMTYGNGTLPSGANFDAALHRFSWKPTSVQAGDFTVMFFVSDGKLTSSITVNIKVIKVNTAPIFTKWIPDTTISIHNVQVLFKYQYKANDAEGDALTYRLDNGPDGATMTSAGLFQWIPKTTQAGQSFLIMVTVSDGSLAETMISTLTTNSTIVGINDEIAIPTQYTLYQNYPNPFNPTTAIKFSMPEQSHVVLKVYDSLGKEVSELINGNISAGQHFINFDASNLTTGIYYYKIQTNKFSETKKMILIK